MYLILWSPPSCLPVETKSLSRKEPSQSGHELTPPAYPQFGEFHTKNLLFVVLGVDPRRPVSLRPRGASGRLRRRRRICLRCPLNKRVTLKSSRPDSVSPFRVKETKSVVWGQRGFIKCPVVPAHELTGRE